MRRLFAGWLWLFIAVSFAVAQDAPPQDPPKDAPKDPKEVRRLQREERASNLWTEAQKLIGESKWTEASSALRELRERYLDTAAYLKNAKEIGEKTIFVGRKIAAVGLQKQGLYKKAHLDTILGFQFNPPDGWRGIPNWQDIFGNRSTSEADYRGRSYRCARFTSRWLETLYLDVYKTYAPTGAFNVLDGASRLKVIDETWQEVSTSSFPHPRYDVQKRLWTDGEGNRIVTYAYYDPATKKGFGINGYWRVRDRENVVVWIKDVKSDPVDDKDWEQAVKVFDQVAKTFAVFDQGTLSATRARYKGSPLAADGWFVQCSDWNIHLTKNYVIEYATRKEFAERLGKELENILLLYQKTIPSQKGIAKGRVKLFDTEEDFQYYGQVPGAAAYWSPMQREIVAYRFEGRKVRIGERGANEEMTVAEERNPEEVTFNIIYHEAFHQYMENIMGISRDVYVPSWLNEGMGDYFFGGRWNKKGQFEIGLNDWRLETIVKAVKEGKHVPLKDIFNYSQQQYYANAGLCYAEGWAICYFFMSEEGRKERYHLIPPMFYAELKKSGNYKSVNQKVLAQYDLGKMEQQWKQFVLGLEQHLPKKPEEKPADAGNKPEDGKKPQGRK